MLECFSRTMKGFAGYRGDPVVLVNLICTVKELKVMKEVTREVNLHKS